MWMFNPGEPFAEALRTDLLRSTNTQLVGITGLVGLPPIVRIDMPPDPEFDTEFADLGGTFFAHRERGTVPRLRSWDPWRWTTSILESRSLATLQLAPNSRLVGTIDDPETFQYQWKIEINGLATSWFAVESSSGAASLQAAARNLLAGLLVRVDYANFDPPLSKQIYVRVESRGVTSARLVRRRTTYGLYATTVAEESYPLTAVNRRWTLNYPTLADNPGTTSGAVDLSAAWYLSGRAITDLLFPVFWSVDAIGNPSPWDALSPLDMPQNLLYGSSGVTPLSVVPRVTPVWP